MCLISFIEKYKILVIFISTGFLFLLYSFSNIWSGNPLQADVVIGITIFGYIIGLIVYLLIKYVFKIHGGVAWHYIRLSWLHSILFTGVAILQIVTRFSLDIPTEAIFALPGFIIVPNAHIYKVIRSGDEM